MNSELEKRIIKMFKNLSGLREEMKDSKIWQREYGKFVKSNKYVNKRKIKKLNPYQWHSKNYNQRKILDNNLSNLVSQMRQLQLNE